MNTLKFAKADPARTVAWPCTISVPQDGGTFQEQKLVARFRVLPTARVQEILKESMGAGQSGDNLLLKECLAGFDGLQDESGNAVADEAALPVLLQIPYVAVGLVRGYYDMVQGRIAKN